MKLITEGLVSGNEHTRRTSAVVAAQWLGALLTRPERSVPEAEVIE